MSAGISTSEEAHATMCARPVRALDASAKRVRERSALDASSAQHCLKGGRSDPRGQSRGQPRGQPREPATGSLPSRRRREEGARDCGTFEEGEEALAAAGRTLVRSMLPEQNSEYIVLPMPQQLGSSHFDVTIYTCSRQDSYVHGLYPAAGPEG